MKYESTNPIATSPSSADEPQARGSHLRVAVRPRPDKKRLEALYRDLLVELGEDAERDGLVRTPERMARSLCELTSGYDGDLETVLNGAVFPVEGYQDPVLVGDVEYYSLCEHHLLPFFGKMSVAYIPENSIIGLSKIPRLIEMFARRLQVQERLTSQVADALEAVIAPRGVAVYSTGFHLCMAMRGVEKQSSNTTTTAFRGIYREDDRLRSEFLRFTAPSR